MKSSGTVYRTRSLQIRQRFRINSHASATLFFLARIPFLMCGPEKNRIFQKKTGVLTIRPQNQKKTEKNRLFFFRALTRGPRVLLYIVWWSGVGLAPVARDCENGAISDVSRFHGSRAHRPSSRVNGQGGEGGKRSKCTVGERFPMDSLWFPLYFLCICSTADRAQYLRKNLPDF